MLEYFKSTIRKPTMLKTPLPQSIELFLFNFCPFAQRVQMSLIQSQLPFEKITLNPAKMPEDFSDISPLGNVPVLRINNTQTIFESAVINDYIAQISPQSMEPEDEVQRAQMRAWSEYSVGCMGAMMQVLQATDIITVKQKNKELIAKFDILSQQMASEGPFFYGQQYTTIDSTYAPLFLRMQTLNQLFSEFSVAGLPQNIQQWMDNLLASETLKQATAEDFSSIYRAFIARAAAGKYIDGQIS
jgi:glutathione S-transferase